MHSRLYTRSNIEIDVCDWLKWKFDRLGNCNCRALLLKPSEKVGECQRIHQCKVLFYLGMTLSMRANTDLESMVKNKKITLHFSIQSYSKHIRSPSEVSDTDSWYDDHVTQTLLLQAAYFTDIYVLFWYFTVIKTDNYVFIIYHWILEFVLYSICFYFNSNYPGGEINARNSLVPWCDLYRFWVLVT